MRVMEVNSDELMGYQCTARKSRNGIAENWSFYEERASLGSLIRCGEKSGAPLKYCAVRHSKTAERGREGKSQRSDRPQVSLFKNYILSYFIYTFHCGLNLSTGGNGMGMGTWQNLQCNGPKFDLLFGKKIIVAVDNRNLKQDIF